MLATTRKDLVQVQLNRLEKELFRHYSLPQLLRFSRFHQQRYLFVILRGAELPMGRL